jgi:hypothetical protein
MEIHQFPPTTIQPLRAPSKAEDGDAGSSGHFYHRSHRPKRLQEKSDQQEVAPSLEENSRIIDIRV